MTTCRCNTKCIWTLKLQRFPLVVVRAVSVHFVNFLSRDPRMFYWFIYFDLRVESDRHRSFFLLWIERESRELSAFFATIPLFCCGGGRDGGMIVSGKRLMRRDEPLRLASEIGRIAATRGDGGGRLPPCWCWGCPRENRLCMEAALELKASPSLVDNSRYFSKIPS